MKKSEFNELEVGDRVIVDGKFGYDFTNERGVIIATNPRDGDVLVRFDSWGSGHGEEDREWHFGVHDVKGFTITVETEKPKAKKAPKGKQAYRGNGKHDWEAVAYNTLRLRVPGGWLYKDIGAGIVFVPVPEVVGYAV